MSLNVFVEILAIAISSAFFTDFLDDCMSEGMIFEKYGRWVRGLGWWGKPIGGCIQCFQFWISVLMIVLYFCLQPLFFAFAVFGLGNKIIKWSVTNMNG
jgi:hypothetical protein